MLLRASLPPSTRCCGALTAGDGDAGGRRAQRLLALGAGCARLREPRTGPCLRQTLTEGPVPALGL